VAHSALVSLDISEIVNLTLLFVVYESAIVICLASVEEIQTHFFNLDRKQL
jgi:hypothetical protein